MTFEEFQNNQEQKYIKDRDTIAGIMNELSKAEILGLLPSIERRYKCGSNWGRTLLDTLYDFADDDAALTLGECAMQTKAVYPDYARNKRIPALDTICGCLSMLSLDYGVYLKKNHLI